MHSLIHCKKKESGQGLIEYLILVALMGVASIVLVTKLNENVKVQFTNVIYGLQGGKKKKAAKAQVREHDYKRTDFSNFMNGAHTGDER